jgi:oxalate---CoA ligase
MPLFHIHGIVAGLLAPLVSGGSLVVSSTVQPSFWNIMSIYAITWITASPTMHNMASQLQGRRRIPTLRFVRSCSSALAPSLQRKLEHAYDCPVLQAYAMTEASHQMASNTLRRSWPGCVGLATSVDIIVVDDHGLEVKPDTAGEICVRGPGVTSGYRSNEAANAAAFTPDGFFRTGDLGSLSADGMLTLHARIKELINRGGEKIFPVEIDEILLQHENIADAVTFAVPDDMYGEVVAAAVIVRDGMCISESDLRAWMRGQVAAYKLPSKVSGVFKYCFTVAFANATVPPTAILSQNSATDRYRKGATPYRCGGNAQRVVKE